MSDGMIRVLVTDEHPALRASVRALLQATGEMRVYEADDPQGILQLARANHPRVVLLGEFAGAALLPVLDHLKRETPATAVLPYLSTDCPLTLATALLGGAAGAVVKHCDPERLVRTVLQTAAGVTHWDRNTVERMLSSSFVVTGRTIDRLPLSAMEREILRASALQLSIGEISVRTGLPEPDILTHQRNMRRKVTAFARRSPVQVRHQRRNPCHRSRRPVHLAAIEV